MSVFSLTPSFSYLVCKYFNLERGRIGGGGVEKWKMYLFIFILLLLLYSKLFLKAIIFIFFTFLIFSKSWNWDSLRILKLKKVIIIKIIKKNEIDARIILQVDHFVYFVFFSHILNLNIQMGIRRKTKNKALAFFFSFLVLKNSIVLP